MILTFSGAAFILSLLLGGKPKNLLELDLQRLPWMLASFIVRDGAEEFFENESPKLWTSALLAVVCYALLFYGILPNLRLPGIGAVALGSLLNLVVIAANGCRMPVSLANLTVEQQAREMARLSVSINHQLLGSGAHLTILSDLFKWTLWQKQPTMFSVGDVLITAGVSYLIFRTTLGSFRPFSHRGKITEAR